MLLQDVLLPPDTLSNRPAAAPSNNGFLYCITDQNNLLVRSNGTSWENYSSTISTGLTQLTGDVTAGPGTGSVAATIAANAVTSGKILDANVTYAKIQDVSAASRLLGRGSASGSGDVEELTISTGLTLTGTTLTAAGSGGTVTAVTASAPLASSGGATPDISLTVPSDATKFLDGTGAFDTVKDSDLSTSNITTNNVTIAKHGFAPILPNDATKYLDGTGAYTVPAGVSTGDVVGPASAVADDIATFNGTTGKLIKDGGKKIADLVLGNVAITPATKTKITYDAKGLVTVGADAVLADLAATTADFSMNSHKLTNVTDPASAQDAATKAYVDATKIVGIEVVIDGGGATITTGIKVDVEVPFACTINRVTMLADQSGSIVVDIWKDVYANYPPVVGDSITASAKPTITTATKSQDATLTGWTTSITAGDTLRFNVDSVTTIQRVTVSLKVTKT